MAAYLETIRKADHFRIRVYKRGKKDGKTNMKKTLVLNETETVKMMIKEVSKTVKSYESDFYRYDLQTFYNMEDGDKRILFLRETGTYFPLSNDTYMINALLESGMDHKRFILIERIGPDFEKSAFETFYKVTKLSRHDLEKMI